MGRIIVAIDGVSGSGKSTTAKAVARQLGYSYVDTGAMYRAITLYFLDHAVDITDPAKMAEALDKIDIDFVQNPQDQKNETILNGECVDDKIRSMEVNNKVSEISALSIVRDALCSLQKDLGKNKGVVMDGRDIGTAIFPDAELKVFLSANVRVRAQRRQLEFQESGKEVSLGHIEENLQQRDQKDRERKHSPLTKAEDAYEIDTSNITLQEQIDEVLNLARKRIAES